MSDVEESLWKLYCIGTVLENKPLTTNNIIFAPLESQPGTSGAPNSSPKELKFKSKDADGNEFETKATVDSGTEAEWFPEGNRVTAPDVVRGEEVYIYRYADTDRYFWREKGDKRHLRRGETQRWMFSANTKQGGDNKQDDTNCIVLEISGHRNLVTLTTPKGKNKDDVSFIVSIDGQNKKAALGDSTGNEFTINNPEKEVGMKNSKGCFYYIANENINVFCLGNYVQKCKNYLLEVQGDYIAEISGNCTKKIGGSYNLEAGNMKANVKGGTDWTTPNFTLNGNLLLNGSIAQGTGSRARVDWSCSFQYPVNFVNEVTIKGVKQSTHTHTEQGDGKNVSSPKNG